MRRLDEAELAHYRREGYVVAKGLFDGERVLDALVAIDQLLCARDPSLRPSRRASVHDDIHEKILRLARRDRRELGRVYDAARKVLPFWSLLGGPELGELVRSLLGTSFVGVAFRGAGIRLDLPHEDRWRSEWHQEYHSQISSPRGLVAWFSLSAVDASMGPVEIAAGSHREGILPVRCLDPLNQAKDYTRTFEIPEVESIARRHAVVSHPTEPGDVVLLDFLLLHRSGFNRSESGRSRITCQVRYFDMTEETAVKNAWVGGWQDGGDFTALHPEKVVA